MPRVFTEVNIQVKEYLPTYLCAYRDLREFAGTALPPVLRHTPWHHPDPVPGSDEFELLLQRRRAPGRRIEHPLVLEVGPGEFPAHCQRMGRGHTCHSVFLPDRDDT